MTQPHTPVIRGECSVHVYILLAKVYSLLCVYAYVGLWVYSTFVEHFLVCLSCHS